MEKNKDTYKEELNGALQRSIELVDAVIVETIASAARRTRFHGFKADEIYKEAAEQVEKMIREKIQAEKLLQK